MPTDVPVTLDMVARTVTLTLMIVSRRLVYMVS